MPTVKQLLRFADPVRHEPRPDARQRERIRQSAAAAAAAHADARPWFRAPLAVAALAVVIVAGIFAVSLRNPRGGATVYAAVRFEVRLAETQPGPGLREARVSGSDRFVYLHDEVVVTNADVERCTAITGSGASRYNIGIAFNAAGARKMREATMNHIDRPAAILIDGEVVMAPTVRVPIGPSAVIDGDYSKAEAERIINGIGVR